MIRHVIRLIWNRRGQNALLMVEILAAFLVVVAVSVMAVHIANNMRQPLGFDIDRVWNVNVSRRSEGAQQAPAQMQETFRQIVAALRDTPEIEVASTAWTGPYVSSEWGSGLTLDDGREVEFTANRADDTFAEVLRMRMVAGRWFSREDVGASWAPVVINERLARDIFGSTDPVGKVIPRQDEPTEPGAAANRPLRVVGVVEEFRQFGELSTPTNYLFHRLSLEHDGRGIDSGNPELPEALFLRMSPGVSAAFEETLVRRFESIAPTWSFSVSPMDVLREESNRRYTLPLALLGGLGGALLLMVGFGLTGVVWQSVTQRTREFGLRRAKGATARNISIQVIVELLTLTSFATAVGCFLVAQILVLPIPDDIAIVSRGNFVMGVVLAAAAVYAVTILSGLYPSWLAARLTPAEALHYE